MSIFQGDTDYLDVPFVDQTIVGALAHINDCGPSDVSALIDAYKGIKRTPDSLYTEFGIVGDTYLSLTQLATMLLKYKIPTTTLYGCTLTNIFEAISKKIPVIVLIRYLPLYNAGLTSLTSPRDFNHFVIVVGINARYVIIHDPYNHNGKNVKVPIDVFMDAWLSVSPSRVMMQPLSPLGELAPVSMFKVKNAIVDNINRRTGPGTEYPLLLGTIPTGNSTYDVNQTAKDLLNRDWYHLVVPDGWCAGWLMQKV